MEFSMNEIAPLIEEAVGSGGTFRLYPRGVSMYPIIDEKTDSVLLGAADGIKKFDAVLYRRVGGKYILHRVVAEKNGTYTMCGDNQVVPEKGIKREQIVAKLTGIYKGDVFVPANDKKLCRRIRFIHAIRPFKRFFRRVVNKIRRTFGKA